MAEIAGLILGVAGLMVPAFEGYLKCSRVIAETKNFPQKFSSFKISLGIQKSLFSGECELLFKGLVDNAILQEMLRDQEHDQWNDASFQTAFHTHIGESLEDKLIPFKVVRENLDKIMEEVSKIEEKVGSSPDLATKTRQMSLDEVSQSVKRIKHKFDWALSKEKLDDLVKTLRRQNKILLQLRNQAEAKERLHGQQGSQALQKVSSSFLGWLEIQEVSRGLRKALTPAACSCHNINLRLDNEAQKPPRLSFRLLHTEKLNIGASNGSTIQHRSTYFTVQSSPGVIHLPRGGSVTGGNNSKRPREDKPVGKAVVCKQPKGKKKVHFGGVSSAAGYVASTSGTPPVSTTSPQAVLGVIDNLCNGLWKANGIATVNPVCLGYVRGDDNYSHMVYRDLSSTLASASCASLYSILSLDSLEKRKLLPRRDRLKLGLLLSLSVLYFGSYIDSWFKEYWRSQDIYFFRDQNGTLSTSSPHILTSLGSCQNDGLSDENSNGTNSQKGGTILARNEQLFSLAIVLIEIACGDLLCNISKGGGQKMGEKDRPDGFREYVEAISALDDVDNEMGKKYTDVVKRCLYCDFGVDETDLAKRKLQDVFYTNVVCKLEECVKAFCGN